MINTVGLLLQPHTEFELSPKVCVNDIIQHWMYLRGHGPYFPYLELLPDEKLKVEFCPSKVLYGQNLYEVSPSDIVQVLVILNTLLQKGHVHTCPTILFYAHTYRFDCAKGGYVPFSHSTLQSGLQDIHRGGQYKQAFTFYADDGYMSASALKRRKVCFYNKSAEVLQDKRNTEELKHMIQNLPGTFYRFECSLKTAKEIRRELDVCGVHVKKCCLAELARTEILQAVLQKNLDKCFCHWHIPDKSKALDKVRRWLDQKQYLNMRTLLMDMLIAICSVYLGVEAVRQIVENQFGKRRAREFIKRFEKLELDEVHCLTVFKERFRSEIMKLKPVNKTEIEKLERKELVTMESACLFAPVLPLVVLVDSLIRIFGCGI